MLPANLRDRFPIFQDPKNKDLVFFDNAASAQKPREVLEVMDKLYRENYANIHRGIYRVAEVATAAYEEARGLVARFINAREAAEVVFSKNATESLNLVAQSYAQTLKPGDGVLLTQMEHHANLVPWQQSSLRYKLNLKYWPITEEGRLDMSQMDKYLVSGVKVVSITAMSNVLGTVNDLKPIIKRAHDVGAIVIVDAAQAAPNIPIDVQDLDCDFLALTGHKIYGPSGVGALYGKRKLLEAMPPFLYGGHMINEVNWDNSTWAELPSKFEAGTPPIVEVVGWGAAIKFMQELGWADILAYEAEIVAYGLDKLAKVQGLKIIGPLTPENRGPVFSFVLEGVHPHDLSSILDNANIAVRAGHHCAQTLHKRFGIIATTRASLAIYNTKEEIDKIVEVIKLAQKKFN